MSIRRLAYLLCALTVLAGATIVPMPFFTVRPGNAVEIAPLIELDESQATELDGSTALLAVLLGRPSIAELAVRALDDDNDIVPAQRYLRGRDDRDYFDSQAVVFQDAFGVAAAVALRAAGEDVQFASAPQVLGVLLQGPSADHLEVGDLILAINGTTVVDADGLVAVARTLDVGDEVTLQVERDGDILEVSYPAGQAPQMDRPGLGITVDTIARDLVLPFEVALADGVSIGGPSAGLLFALTVYDLVAEENLLDGRRVTGTGTIELDGTVGEIGSVRQKVTAAIANDYEVFLAPISQATEARDEARGRIEVLGVATFTEALQALRAPAAPGPQA